MNTLLAILIVGAWSWVSVMALTRALFWFEDHRREIEAAVVG